MGRGCSLHPMALLATPPYTTATTASPASSSSSISCSLRAPGRSVAYRSRGPRAMAAPGSDAAGSAPPSLLVFSGGTAFNGVVEELKKVTTRVAHVLPVSDDGGSTAEIVRVLGGPAVGDIRSRCLRLSDESTVEALSVRRLLGHRLTLDPSEAKLEWYQIVEGEHSLWDGVSRPYRETIRAFLVYFHNEILRRPVETFCFTNGSIGNFFFAGARIFFQSLDAAIFLFSRVSQIPAESLVLPVISTNDRLTLGCELWDGTIIRGQNEISHPSNGSREVVNKDCDSCTALPSSIKRVFYMSSEGSNLLHEVFPKANQTVLEQLSKVDCIVYAMGSLFTSVCPSLVLRGIGETIASRSIPKVLLLNGSHDRETIGLCASGFVTAITDSLNRTYGDPDKSLKNSPKDYVNALLVPKGGQIPLDIENLASKGIFHVVTVESLRDAKVGAIFDPDSLIQALTSLISEHIDAPLLEPDCVTENVLLLNGSHDRETIGLCASGFVTAITDSLNRTYGDPDKSLKNSPKDYVNALLVPKGGQIPLDIENLASKGIFHVVTVESLRDAKVGAIFDPDSLIQALTSLISEHIDAPLLEPDCVTENVKSVC